MKTSVAILSEKMALDMAKRMYLVWNISTFHGNGALSVHLTSIAQTEVVIP
jgi:hypothetical protein